MQWQKLLSPVRHEYKQQHCSAAQQSSSAVSLYIKLNLICLSAQTITGRFALTVFVCRLKSHTHTHTPKCSLRLPELITLGLQGPAWSLDDPCSCTVCTLSTPNSLPATASKRPPHSSICFQRSDQQTIFPKKISKQLVLEGIGLNCSILSDTG